MEDEMDIKVLVAYSTKYGSTAEIAKRIGRVLSQAGLQADVLDVKSIKGLTNYKAVVLGSAVYMGRWRREAGKFLKANEKLLAERLVWLFSSGPTDDGDPLELVEGLYLPKALQPVAERIRPKDIAVFHGALKLEKLNFIYRWMIKKVEAPAGDFRDWEAITSWTEGIVDEIKRFEGTL
jgi:menaquinone-dependent protoporphyrinogen oxidase